MGWFRRRRNRKPDEDLAAEHRAADARLSRALASRDTERRKLRDEDRTLVQPMQRARHANHFAELATSALLQRDQR
jgi:hypothetical protein